MRFFRTAAAAALLYVYALPAHAQDIFRQYESIYIAGGGNQERIAFFGAPDPSCERGGTPEISIVEHPSYGKLVLSRDQLLALDRGVPPSATDCAGRLLDGTAVLYEPAPGFFGSDRVVLRVRFPGSDGRPAETMVSEIYVKMR